MKAIWYLLVAVLGALGLLAAFRALELLFLGGLTAYGAGRLAGSVFMAILLLVLAAKSLSKARAA